MTEELLNDVLDIIVRQLNIDRLESMMIKKSDIKDSDLFFDDLNADDLDMIELFMELEEAFSISLDDDIIQTTLTVGKLVEIIHNQCRDKHR